MLPHLLIIGLITQHARFNLIPGRGLQFREPFFVLLPGWKADLFLSSIPDIPIQFSISAPIFT